MWSPGHCCRTSVHDGDSERSHRIPCHFAAGNGAKLEVTGGRADTDVGAFLDEGRSRRRCRDSEITGRDKARKANANVCPGADNSVDERLGDVALQSTSTIGESQRDGKGGVRATGDHVVALVLDLCHGLRRKNFIGQCATQRLGFEHDLGRARVDGE